MSQDPFDSLGVAATESELTQPGKDPFETLGTPERGLGEQAAAGFASGLKKGAAPGWVTPEEYRHEQTGFEALIDATTNIATGVAVPVAATAAAGVAGAGAATAATVGTIAALAYGAYSGIGNEWSRSRAEGQDFSPARAAVQVGLEINGIIKSAKKLVLLARVAAQVGAATGVEYSYTGDAKRAMATGVFTAIAAPLLYRGIRQPTPNAGKSLADALAPGAGPGLAAHAETKFQALGAAGTQMPAAKDLPKDFMRMSLRYTPAGVRTEGKLAERFAAKREAVGADKLQAEWELYQRGRALAEAAAEANAHAAAKLDGSVAPDISKVREWAAPAEFVSRKIDDVVGTDFEGAVSDVARTSDQLALTLHGYLKRGTDLAAERAKLKLTPETVAQALDGQGAAVAKVTDAGGAGLLTTYRKLLGDVHEELQAAGYKLPSAELPAMPKVGAEAMFAARRGPPKSIWEAFGEQPEHLREWNVDRLLTRYLNGNLRAAYMEPVLSRVASYKSAFDALGMRNASAWTQDYLNRMSGGQGFAGKHWNAAMENIRVAGYEALAKDPDSTWGKVALALPATLAKLNAAVYPAQLAFNQRAFFRNMMQSMFTTAPELQGVYGYNAVARGMAQAAWETKGSPTALKALLKSAGQLGGLVNEIAAPAVSAVGKLGRGAQRASELGMAAYQYADLANRAIALKVGEAWAQDLAKGVPGAIKALRAASTGLKIRIDKLGGADADSKALASTLGDYLITKTQFRYGAATQAKGLAHAGSALSQFTKWPLMSTWDLVERAQHKDWRGLASRALPLTGLLMAAKIAKDHQSDHDPVWVAQRYFIGNPVEWSPYPSILQAPSPDRLGSPLVRAPFEAASALVESGTRAVEGRSREPLRPLRDLARFGVKNFVPPVSSLVNEADRIQAALKGSGHATASRDLINRLTGGPKGD